ncbi:hypothetical protein E2C01_069447 [Portunus trituberculatus]|uniref:Uncharacterized protein n=1 Tax=Portunus trituberculatus TaxID=210409 RepID=A0A5B7HYK5_PORTR|nr:hypothetical protein [Portunus trituberculatus]
MSLTHPLTSPLCPSLTHVSEVEPLDISEVGWHHSVDNVEAEHLPHTSERLHPHQRAAEELTPREPPRLCVPSPPPGEKEN